MKKLIWLISLLFITILELSGQKNSNFKVRIILFFNSISTYQISIGDYTYEFKNGGDAGIMYATLPDSCIFISCPVNIRTKKKHSLKWENCTVFMQKDSAKKYIIFYRDFLLKDPCFNVIYTNEITYRERKLYDENDKEFEKYYLPDRIFVNKKRIVKPR